MINCIRWQIVKFEESLVQNEDIESAMQKLNDELNILLEKQ